MKMRSEIADTIPGVTSGRQAAPSNPARSNGRSRLAIADAVHSPTMSAIVVEAPATPQEKRKASIIARSAKATPYHRKLSRSSGKPINGPSLRLISATRVSGKRRPPTTLQ
jgi:hypothetical protein